MCPMACNPRPSHRPASARVAVLNPLPRSRSGSSPSLNSFECSRIRTGGRAGCREQAAASSFAMGKSVAWMIPISPVSIPDLEKLQLLSVSRRQALKIKLGRLGSCPRVSFPTRRLSKRFSRTMGPTTNPAMALLTSRFRPQSWNTGSVISSLKFVALEFSKLSLPHRVARITATSPPADTAEIAPISTNLPPSLSRQNPPRWKRLARKPPPDSARPICSSLAIVILTPVLSKVCPSGNQGGLSFLWIRTVAVLSLMRHPPFGRLVAGGVNQSSLGSPNSFSW